MTAPASSRLAHDLRGPLVTIEGFVGEISAALDELESLLADGAPAADVSTRLAVLLDADLRPCIGFVTRAASMMHTRIDALDEPAARTATPSDGSPDAAAGEDSDATPGDAARDATPGGTT